ncbi:hypothetical protein KC19_VG181800 [Ceratodon purpureus]|uniref:Secreted protein n=1 Tax=Ceratodon purpureus TaxID=3225 RepID=A0A8T0HRK6_CERPU|nr:hypothetical protein KC19_VG181800 [Ceratodon purpureus]
MMSAAAFMAGALSVTICTTLLGPISSMYFCMIEAWDSVVSLCPEVSTDPRKCSPAGVTITALDMDWFLPELHPSNAKVAPKLRAILPWTQDLSPPLHPNSFLAWTKSFSRKS